MLLSASTAPGQAGALAALTRAGLTHLYFVCIHPFENGNGRIARALAEKSLSQCLGQSTLVALSQTIQEKRKAYYSELEQNNKRIEMTNWLVYFAQTVLEAQTTRDLQELLALKALTRTGSLKTSRYWINIGLNIKHQA